MMMEMKEAQHIREFTKKTKAKAHTPHKGIVEVVTISDLNNFFNVK